MNDITLEQAYKIAKAAYDKALEMNLKMDIAIVDAGANLKAFIRMDGAWLGSIDIAIKKAKTARFFDMPTGEIGKLSQPGESLYQHRSFKRRLDFVSRRHSAKKCRRRNYRCNRRFGRRG